MKSAARLITTVLSLAALLITGGCNDVDTRRIPLATVRVNFSTVGDWNIYGVAGAATARRFIRSAGGVSEPIGFPYTALSATGFGGVLLVAPYVYSGNPLDGTLTAFDLACPVEQRPDVRIEVDHVHHDARCPVCGSTYDIFNATGMPLSGPAAEDRYALRRYSVGPGVSGQYLVISN